MTLTLSELLTAPAPVVAPQLLGSVVLSRVGGEIVGIRLTEVEAYGGPADTDYPDPGSHTFRGQTARNAAMFGPPAHLYVYFTYGLHHAVNLVCRPDGIPGGVLLRGGEVVMGASVATRRRRGERGADPQSDVLARGPGNFAQALGLTRQHDAAALRDLGTAADPVRAIAEAARQLSTDQSGTDWVGLMRSPQVPTSYVVTPRTGVSGPGGSDEFPWRFALAKEPTVSPYRKAAPKKRRTR